MVITNSRPYHIYVYQKLHNQPFSVKVSVTESMFLALIYYYNHYCIFAVNDHSCAYKTRFVAPIVIFVCLSLCRRRWLFNIVIAKHLLSCQLSVIIECCVLTFHIVVSWHSILLCLDIPYCCVLTFHIVVS